MPTISKRLGDFIGLNKTKSITPESKNLDEAKKVQDLKATAQKADKAVETKIEKSNEPGKVAKALTKAKTVSKEKKAAMSSAVKDFFKSKNKTENKKQTAKAKMEFEKAKNEKISSYKVNAKELVKSIKAFENIDPKTNQLVSAKKRYEKAVKTFLNDLNSLDGKVSREEFISLIKDAQKDKSVRIYADARYGEAFKKENKGISLSNFINILLGSESKVTQKAYDKDIKDIANKLAASLKNVKNNQDATTLTHSKFEAINNLANKNEYKNVLGKNSEVILSDLNSAVIAQLGGKKAVETLIKNIETLIKSPYDFDKGVQVERSKIQKDLAAQLKGLNRDFSKHDKRLKELDDQEKALAKEKQDLLSQVKTNKDGCDARRTEAQEEVASIDLERSKINAEKARISGKTDSINETKPKVIEALRKAHLSNLLAQRRVAGALISDMKLNDIEDLPRDKTSLDTLKRYGYNSTLYGLVPAAVVAGAGAGYYYYDPVGASAAYKAAGKAVADSSKYAGVQSSKVTALIAEKASAVKEYAASFAQKYLGLTPAKNMFGY